MVGELVFEKVSAVLPHSLRQRHYYTFGFRYDDKYNLVLSFRDGKSGSTREATVKKSVAYFVDVNGAVVGDVVDVEVTKLHNSLVSERKDK